MQKRLKCPRSCTTWLRIAAGSTRCCEKPPTTLRQTKDARKQFHVSLALLPVDAAQVNYLFGRLLDAEPHEVPVIRDALAPHKDAELLDKLWAVVEAPDKGKESATAACGGGAWRSTTPRTSAGRTCKRPSQMIW